MDARPPHTGTNYSGAFPETFKDFFSMIEEDCEDLCGNSLLEDKVIPRYHHQRSPSVKSAHVASRKSSLVPADQNIIRTSSFRVHRSSSTLSTAPAIPDVCKHTKYCCLHQNAARPFSDRPTNLPGIDTGVSLGNSFNLNEFNNYMNFNSDTSTTETDFSEDPPVESGNCTCECDSEYHPVDGDVFVKKANTKKKLPVPNKTTSYCLRRHNKSSSSFRTTKPSTSIKDNNLNSFIDQDTAILSTELPKKTEISPIFARRRASVTSISIGRTIPNIPNFNQAPMGDMHRYLKTADEQQKPRGHHLPNIPSGRLEGGQEKYTRSKSPNIQSRMSIEVSNPISAIPAIPTNRQRARTGSMPAENRKPRLAETRRSAIHCADMDIEYYRLRSFSITSHGICNLGDSMRSRRSRSINSVTSTGTSNSGRQDRINSTGSQNINDIKELEKKDDAKGEPAYKIAMLGESGVGKTTLTYQFTTSEYICAYDLSLDDDYGQKTVSVLLDEKETDLEVIDHPACEMSVEAFCSTYNIDLFVVAYSVVDRKSFKTAEHILIYLKDNEMMLTRGVILVGNKTDLERHREVPIQAARKLAKEVGCKFIETSSGLGHNVDELLVGIVAQVQLNKQRVTNLTEKQRKNAFESIQQKTKRSDDQEMRSNQRKTNMKRLLESSKPRGTLSNKENRPSRDDDSDDELSDDSGPADEPNAEAVKVPSTKYSSVFNLNRFLSYRKYANQDQIQSSSSCSTTPIHGPATPSTQMTSTSKKRFSYDATMSRSPKKSSEPVSEPQTGDDSDSNDKCINKFSNRTKLFLTSFLKFKRSLRVKRRNSNSCSDLFVM